MIRQEEVYKIGVFNKPHGIHGELSMTFTDDVFDRVDGEYVICLMDGILVPFFIEEYRFRSDSTLLMKLDRVDTAEEARRFTNVEVYFPKQEAEEVPEEDLTWSFFIGYILEDLHTGEVGKITDLDTTTPNTLFVVETPSGELLVPAHEALIAGVDRKHMRLVMDLPEGLIDPDLAVEES
ncbi:MAG: ribosome maturation factor RimM [Bacteroides sp.]|nr:ribosome maturation factor RimM [Bacteroides sp.]